MEIQNARWLCNARQRPRWPVVWARCPCLRPRWPFLLPILHRWISQFHIPPRWGSGKGEFKGKGGRGTKGVLPSATAPCNVFLPKAETKNEVVEATCPTTSTGSHTAWCALPMVPCPPPLPAVKTLSQVLCRSKSSPPSFGGVKEVGAVEEVSLQGTQFLVPWFVIRKRE